MSSPPQSGAFTESRIGVVTIATVNSLFVNVGDTVIEAAFLMPFTATAAAPPPAGTVVQLVRQDMSWVAVGRVVGTGTNPILNPSFELSVPGSPPAGWQQVDVSGASVAIVEDIVGAPQGDFAARVQSDTTSVHYLYSEAIAVSTGETWSLGAFAGGDYSGGLQTADAALGALWFANPTDLYPTTSSADSIAVSILDVPQYPPFQPLSGTVVVPAATFFMRVALRSTLVAGQALLWDNITARRS